MSTHFTTQPVAASRVAEYEKEIQALLQRLNDLGTTSGLPSLSEEIQQTYSTTLDHLAALQVQLYLCHQSLLAHERTADRKGDGYNKRA
jgi:ABC-type hemin transport system substrate-binding protein